MRVADPTIVARTGWTTDELSAGIDDAHPAGPFDLVTLLIGVNNQYRGRSADEYREQFRALLDAGDALCRRKRVARRSCCRFRIGDSRRSPSGRDRAHIAAEIDAFNAVNRDEAARGGARYVDITPISRRVPQEPGLVAGDGLHPSGEMYARWVDETLPVALEILAPTPADLLGGIASARTFVHLLTILTGSSECAAHFS